MEEEHMDLDSLNIQEAIEEIKNGKPSGAVAQTLTEARERNLANEPPTQQKLFLQKAPVGSILALWVTSVRGGVSGVRLAEPRPIPVARDPMPPSGPLGLGIGVVNQFRKVDRDNTWLEVLTGEHLQGVDNLMMRINAIRRRHGVKEFILYEGPPSIIAKAAAALGAAQAPVEAVRKKMIDVAKAHGVKLPVEHLGIVNAWKAVEAAAPRETKMFKRLLKAYMLAAVGSKHRNLTHLIKVLIGVQDPSTLLYPKQQRKRRK